MDTAFNSAKPKRNKIIYIHIFSWIALFTLLILQNYLDRNSFPKRLTVELILAFFIFYFNYAVLVPKLLLRKKTSHYIISVVTAIIMAVAVSKLMPFDVPPKMETNEVSGNFKRETLPPPKPQEKFKFFDFGLMFPLFFNLGFIVIGTSMRMYEEWNKNERKKQEIETSKKTTELHYLKHQLNPHFLFNSLNSIYSLTTKKSDDAPEAVLTLSELMRYMLYKTDNDYVLLSDELEYIKNYLKLQRLRIAKNENISINIHGAVSSQKIRPLMLISFIENAFKHGTDFMGNTMVQIIITVNDDMLNFSCVNLIGNRKKTKENSGIGLINTRERLELLYPNKYKLLVTEEENKFKVELTLDLSL